MLEVADIFRLHGPAYREKFGDRMLPSHRRAMQDIETCRTESLGGQLYFCKQCQAAALQLSLLQEPPLSQVPERAGQ